VTDAAVALGYIDPHHFLGGEIVLDREAALKGIATKVAAPLKMDRTEAACGILTIANAKMAGVIRTITIERGHDPRDFTLVGFGGAGPLFAASIGDVINSRQVLIPRFPGNFSAWGMLSTDLVHDLARTQLESLAEVKWHVINDKFAELEKEAGAALDRDGVPRMRQKLIRSIDARYWAQGHFITLPVKSGGLDESYRHELTKQFHRMHKRVFGHELDDSVVLATFRVRGIGRMPKLAPARASKRKRGTKLVPKGSRRFPYFVTRQMHTWTIYDREELMAGDTFAGPALIEEGTSVSIVPPRHNVIIDKFGNILIRKAS
jgi:N-methylhydantoinase A